MKRRQFLTTTTATLTLLSGGSALAGKNAQPTLLFVILRGGMDGLAALAPFGDASYRKSRGELALPPPGKPEGVLAVDDFFGLHPRFTQLSAMFRAREALAIHAAAPPYAGRSHFDAQDVLEAGVPQPSGSSDGWLYRALPYVNGASSRAEDAYALGSNIPLVLRGSETVGAWSPDRLPDPDQDTMDRISALYAEDDYLGPKLTAVMESDAIAMNAGMNDNHRAQLQPIVEAAARFLSNPDGPQIAVVEATGWDTHARQGTTEGQLANRFSQLDTALGHFKKAMGSAWQDTVVMVATEFGRTVAANGTRGTDHGVGGVSFLLGGRVHGGKVVGDWPGLAPTDLHEGRDLLPTTDLRSVFAGVLRDHMGVPAQNLAEVFPDYAGVMGNLFVSV